MLLPAGSGMPDTGQLASSGWEYTLDQKLRSSRALNTQQSIQFIPSLSKTITIFIVHSTSLDKTLLLNWTIRSLLTVSITSYLPKARFRQLNFQCQSWGSLCPADHHS